LHIGLVGVIVLQWSYRLHTDRTEPVFHAVHELLRRSVLVELLGVLLGIEERHDMIAGRIPLRPWTRLLGLTLPLLSTWVVGLGVCVVAPMLYEFAPVARVEDAVYAHESYLLLVFRRLLVL